MVRATRSCICEFDLHLYKGDVPGGATTLGVIYGYSYTAGAHDGG